MTNKERARAANARLKAASSAHAAAPAGKHKAADVKPLDPKSLKGGGVDPTPGRAPSTQRVTGTGRITRGACPARSCLSR
jgi:hypothetical protein